MKFSSAIVALALLLTIGVPPTAAADAPVGFQLMCLKMPQECRGGGKSVIDAEPSTMSLLKRVNLEVNGSIRPKRDGRVDQWSVGVSQGDCEDYVLTKRRLLRKAGLPPSALRIASVKTRAGEAHAVLVVRTTSGDYVLDNLTDAIRPLPKSGYRVSAMSSSDPRVWI
ncbi:MAG TPA: transglutaminase-like cysteine peptidase [Devosia sp.]|jgi:predicted transglutaminase-like cysteine proteinase|nr:transglutaminase-like cysteine peptidase [Devosia sp.]